ncbi:hypothetical protein PF005_g24641 [Phytophthora fragariae]|uniref:Uncharacterized protein n=1 Tax=Phytophthora fragariae TaxID=53985 RepID=A0A6A3W180_9STRA|nr:hypothetical protein PF005_g24641 [Phytophthora fragariae]
MPETDHDEDENMEAEACTLQAASIIPARDEESMPETDHDENENMETEACTLQAGSVNPARDEESLPETDHDENEIMETEACTLLADSVNPARNKESTPETGHDEDENVDQESATAPDHAYDDNTACDEESAPEPNHDFEMKMELEACAQQADSANTARDEAFTLEPDPDYELTMKAGACAQQAASVATARDEESASKSEPDRSKDAARVPFLGLLCGPDPKRSVVFEVDWGLASVAPLDTVVAEDNAESIEKNESAPAEPSLTSAMMSVASEQLGYGRSLTLVGERGCPASRLPRTTNIWSGRLSRTRESGWHSRRVLAGPSLRIAAAWGEPFPTNGFIYGWVHCGYRSAGTGRHFARDRHSEMTRDSGLSRPRRRQEAFPSNSAAPGTEVKPTRCCC